MRKLCPEMFIFSRPKKNTILKTREGVNIFKFYLNHHKRNVIGLISEVGKSGLWRDVNLRQLTHQENTNYAFKKCHNEMQNHNQTIWTTSGTKTIQKYVMF
jgi:hypothetical protein